MTTQDGLPITQDVTVHTPAGPSQARWTWSPRWPITARLVVDLPDGYDVLSFSRVDLYRAMNAVHPPKAPDCPESLAWIGVAEGRRVLWCQLTPHQDREYPGLRWNLRTLRLWTSWVKAATFLGRTFATFPACPYRGGCGQTCDECQVTQDALVGQLLAQEPTP